MYTPYEGQAFINSYFDARKHAFSEFTSEELSLEKLLASIPNDNRSATYQKIRSNFQCSELKEFIIGKIERRKRLYEAYTPDGRKGIGSYENFSVYAISGLFLAATIQSTRDTRELNALLKLNDILIAHKEQSSSKFDAQCCAYSIKTELAQTECLWSTVND